jgi:hypothetical protein
MTGAIPNQGKDLTIILIDGNIVFTESEKIYVTLHLTMDITFDGDFSLSLFTTPV